MRRRALASVGVVAAARAVLSLGVLGVLLLVTVAPQNSGAASPPPPRPHLAGLYVKTYRPSGSQGFLVKFAGPKLPWCEQVRPVTFKVVLKAKGVRYSTSNKWCDSGVPGIGALGRNGLEPIWEERGAFFWNAIADGRTTDIWPDPDALFFATRLSGQGYRRTVTFGYWVVIGGKLARSGRLQVRVDSYLRTIWDDEDDFVNICINDLKRLYSSGGRLHCFNHEFDYSMKLLR